MKGAGGTLRGDGKTAPAVLPDLVTAKPIDFVSPTGHTKVKGAVRGCEGAEPPAGELTAVSRGKAPWLPDGSHVLVKG